MAEHTGKRSATARVALRRIPVGMHSSVHELRIIREYESLAIGSSGAPLTPDRQSGCILAVSRPSCPS